MQDWASGKFSDTFGGLCAGRTLAWRRRMLAQGVQGGAKLSKDQRPDRSELETALKSNFTALELTGLLQNEFETFRSDPGVAHRFGNDMVLALDSLLQQRAGNVREAIFFLDAPVKAVVSVLATSILFDWNKVN
jgi:hypothetical protein